ncbi:MAG: CARDB domain-containing protein, partial [Candidatus Eisenbacteria bacterium]
MITFTSLSGLVGDWDGIYFTDESDDAGAVSRMEYCVVEKGGQTDWGLGVRANVYCRWTSQPGVMSHCVLRDGLGNGLHMEESSIAVTSCEFLRNNVGVYCNNASPSVILCNVMDNADHGIYCTGNSSPLIGDSRDYSCNLYGAGRYDVYNNTANDIYARYNFWGTGDSTAIATHIYDRADEGSRGRVYVSPFITVLDTYVRSGPRENEHVNVTAVRFSWFGTDDTTPAESLMYSYRLDENEWSLYSPDTSHVFTDLSEGLHTFMVRAMDQDSNVDSIPAVRRFVVDLTEPNTQVADGPEDGDWINTAYVDFVWSGTDNFTPPEGLFFSYRMDSTEWSAFSREKSHRFENLSDTTHIFAVRAKDFAGNVEITPLTVQFGVDLGAPETWFVSGPPDSSTIGPQPVALCWTGSDSHTDVSGLKYSHRLDDGGYSAFALDTCHVFTNLSGGWHRILVKAQDTAANEDPSPAERSLLVDATPPELTFTDAPEENEFLGLRDVRFEWTGSDDHTQASQILFAYSLDSTDTCEFSSATTVELVGLEEGTHHFALLALDAVGNIGTAVRSFAVDLTPPQTIIVSGPQDGGFVNTASVTFVWSGTDNLCPPESLAFSYRLDETAWSEFSRETSHTFDSLSVQSHVFQVRARDKAGHEDSVWVSRSFSLDFGTPETQIVLGPQESSILRANTFAFSWSGSDSITPKSSLRFSYKLDAGAFSPPGPDTSRTFTNVPDGYHVFQVKALDAATNEDPTPAVRSFYTDVTPPSVVFVQGPPSGAHISVDSTTVAWQGTDAVASSQNLLYAYRLDLGSETSFAGTRAALLSGLAEGLHSLRVRARDEAGNIGSSTLGFGVDITPPNTSVISGPANGGWWPSSTVTFTWLGSDNLSGSGDLFYSFALDDSAFSTFSGATSRTFQGLELGVHRFVVTSRDKAGHEDTSPDTVTFAVGFVDLVVRGVSIPESAFYNSPVAVSWTVENSGDGPALGPWKDHVYMSSDSLVGGDSLLAIVDRVGVLDGGGTYSGTCTVRIPYCARDTMWIIVVVDGGGAVVEEGNEGNNSIVSSHPVILSIPAHPDLVVQSIAPPIDGWSGQGTYVEWTVLNQGGDGAAGPWVDRVYLSLDSLIGNDVELTPPFYYNYTLASQATYTHSHPVVFPHDIQGDYWLVVLTDAQDSVEEYVEDDNNAAIAALSFPIHLTPFPDLRVDSVVVPPIVDAGSGLPFSWTVSNHGSAPTSAPVWYDEIYLSTNSVLDGGDVFLGKFANLTYLNVGTGYVQNKSVTLPANISGTYYVIVKTDAQGHVYEHNNEGNNAGASGPFTVNFVPAPWCGLEVKYLTPITSVWSGQTVSLTWVLENVGTGPMASTHFDDAFALSPDSVFHQSGWFSVWHWHNTDHPLAPGERDTLTANVTFPSDKSGNWYLFLIPDSHLNGGCGGIPLGRPITIRAAPSPDLEVASVSIAGDTAFTGAQIKVGWSARNNGPGPSGATSWQDCLWLSDDDVFAPGVDQSLGAKTHYGYLDVDAGYADSLEVTLPYDALGSYYLFVCTDGTNAVPEGQYEGNNCCRTLIPLEIVLPPAADLQVVTIGAPSGAGSGDTVNVTWTVRNNGPAATVVESWTDVLHISADSTLEVGADSCLVRQIHSGKLGVGGQYVASSPGVIPNGLSGTYYLIVRTDLEGRVYEGGAFGNNVLGKSLTVSLTPPPDLQVSNLVVPATGQSGKQLGIQWTVSNKGTGGTRAVIWEDAVYLSVDPTLEPNADTRLAVFTRTGALGPAGGYVRNENVTIPEGLVGSRYIIVRTDAGDKVYEHLNNGNNDRFALTVVQSPPKPDLDVIAFELLSADSCLGTARLRWTVKNPGGGLASGSWVDAVYLSNDQILDAAVDQVVASKSRTDVLGSGATYIVETTAQFPRGTEGVYYLFIKTDSGNRLVEASEVNNVDSLQAGIAIVPIDLVVTSVDGRDSANTGQPVTVSWTVRNNGLCATGQSTWYDAVYLSRDRILDASDYVVSSVRHDGALEPGQGYVASVQVQIPSGLAGTYYWFAVTDKNNDIHEQNGEANNFCLDPSAIIVLVPPRSDLLVASVMADSTGVPGEDIEIRWSVANAGDNVASGMWTDALYVSSDSTQSVEDVLLGTSTYTAHLPAGSAISRTLALSYQQLEQILGVSLPGIQTGAYRVLVATDVRNCIPESNEANNVGVSQGPLRTTIPLLPPDTPLRLVVPPNAQRLHEVLPLSGGEDLRISSVSLSGSATLELFVGHERIPTPSNYTYRASQNGSGSTSVTVPSAGLGSHFVLLKNVSSTETDSVELMAEILQPEIESVSPTEVGCSGRVTFRVRGSGFTDGSVVMLCKSDAPCFVADTVVLMNSTELLTRFTLSGADTGRYTLRISGQGMGVLSFFPLHVVKESYASIRVSVAGPNVVREDTEHWAIATVQNDGNTDTGIILVLLTSPRWLRFSVSLNERESPEEALLRPVLVEAEPYGEMNVLGFFTHPLPPGGMAQVPISFSASGTGSSTGDNALSVQVISLSSAALGDALYEAYDRIKRERPELDVPPVTPLTPEQLMQINDRAWHALSTFMVFGGKWIVIYSLIGGVCVVAPQFCPALLALGKMGFVVDLAELACDELLDLVQYRNILLPVTVGRSRDPNEKLGPTPVAEPLVAQNQSLPYTVYFENTPNATAAAREVVVTDALDAGLDLRKFRLAEIGFGDTTVIVPENRSYWQSLVNLDSGYLLEIDAGIDVSTREAHW